MTARLWTGKGDDGTTGLLYGGRVGKSSPQIDAVGAVDEAQAAIGVARAEVAAGSELDELLIAVCRDLYVLMAELATRSGNRSKLTAGTTLVTEEMVAAIEQRVTELSVRFELATEFVVPGQDRVSACLDVALTVVRRAERAAVPTLEGVGGSFVLPYLNRLSTLLWTLARWAEGEPRPTRTLHPAP